MAKEPRGLVCADPLWPYIPPPRAPLLVWRRAGGGVLFINPHLAAVEASAPADDQSARRARRIFSCPPYDLCD